MEVRGTAAVSAIFIDLFHEERVSWTGFKIDASRPAYSSSLTLYASSLKCPSIPFINQLHGARLVLPRAAARAGAGRETRRQRLEAASEGWQVFAARLPVGARLAAASHTHSIHKNVLLPVSNSSLYSLRANAMLSELVSIGRKIVIKHDSGFFIFFMRVMETFYH